MDRVEKAIKDVNNIGFYSILEIHKTDDQEAIKKAYKKLIKKYHPDKNKDADTVEKFDKIKIAYELLKNEELKALYDSKLKAKEERKSKQKVMNVKRKKFIEDLENREKASADASSTNYTDEFKEKNLYKQYEKEYNKMYEADLITSNAAPKKKSLDEKFNKYGIKIKWKKDIDLIFTKEILATYFKEYGQIEEIVLPKDENKALILFNNEKSIKDVLSSNNGLINKLFKIKKYSKKEFIGDKPKPDFSQHSFFDAETLEKIKSQKFFNNLKFMEHDQQNNLNNKLYENKNLNSNTKTNTMNSYFNKEANFDNMKTIKKESSQKYNFNNDIDINDINNNKINTDLDLDSLEKLIFQKIKK